MADSSTATQHKRLPGGTPVVRVAPHPTAGWVVEDDCRELEQTCYSDRDEAIAEARRYVNGHGGGCLIVHDWSNPAAGQPASHTATPQATLAEKSTRA